MGNQFGLRCPSCEGTDEIDVRALVWIRLFEDGTDAYVSEDRNSEWGERSEAYCAACGFTGRIKEFVQQPRHEAVDQGNGHEGILPINR
jgi:hypothetical protein